LAFYQIILHLSPGTSIESHVIAGTGILTIDNYDEPQIGSIKEN